VLTVDLATNVLASALWELAVKPLYRGLVRLPDMRRGKHKRVLDAAIKQAAQALADAHGTRAITKATWAEFFELDEVRTVVQDVFMFRMDVQDPSMTEIRVAFRGLWKDHSADRGVAKAGEVDIDGMFDALVEGVTHVLEVAIETDVLAAHEATSVARHRLVEARLGTIESLVRSAGDQTATMEEAVRFEGQLRSEVAVRFSKLEPPNLQGRERVDLERLFVVPRLGSASAPGAGEETDYGSFLRTLQRRVVLGNPGAGKSTLAARTCHLLASEYDSAPIGLRRLTPWFIELRRFASADGGSRRSLVDYFEYWARASYQLDVPPGAFDWLLARGRLFVVFDGLDELLDTSLRQDVRNQVESFCRRYATTPVLVTSRLVGYDQAPLDPVAFDKTVLLDFDDPRVRSYAVKWFDIRLDRESEDDRRRHAEAFVRDSAVAGELRNSPLLLALLVSLHRGPASIPNNLPDVYDACANLLFSTWDKDRDIAVVLPFAEHVRPALRELAWWIFNDARLSSGGVTRRQAVDRTARYLAKRRFGDLEQALAAAEDFISFCRGRAWVFSDQGSTASGEDLFGFTHRTFMEFFAAEHLAYRKQTAEELVNELAPKIFEQEWDIVSLIALQIKARSYPDGADDVVKALVAHLQTRKGGELMHGVRFLLRLLRAVIPSPGMTRVLGARLTVIAVREAYHADRDRRLAGRELLNAMSGVGPEVSGEFARGAAATERKLIRENSVVRKRIGSELMFRSDDVLPGHPADTRAAAFWRTVGQEASEKSADSIVSAAAEDGTVALDAWPGHVDTDWLLRNLSLKSLVVTRDVTYSGLMSKPPVEVVLRSLATSEDERRQWARAQLTRIAVELRRHELPWLRLPHRGLMWPRLEALDLLARSRHQAGRLTAEERFALWAVTALATDDLSDTARRGNRNVVVRDELTSIERLLTSAKAAPLCRDVGRVVCAPDEASLLAAVERLDLVPEDAAIVKYWWGDGSLVIYER
jgi:hypothetical protein